MTTPNPSTEQKFKTVVNRNTFYFFNPEFEDQNEMYLNSLKQTLLVLKNKIETEGLEPKIFEDLLLEKEYGLRALLALTGVSNETLKRLTTIIRAVDDPELSKLVHRSGWCEDANSGNLSEFSDDKVATLIRDNEDFRKGIVNIFFQGSTVPFLVDTIPPFELKKLSISKLNFELPDMIDTLIRYKEKGSYSAKQENNPERVIAAMLDERGIYYGNGDLRELVKNAPDTKRTMDFIIPSKQDPQIIVEISFLATTSSGQGDKSKTEISVGDLIKSHYPNAKFVGFVDGIGWYVRKSDLGRMVGAYEDVFTFHADELQRFGKLLDAHFP